MTSTHDQSGARTETPSRLLTAIAAVALGYLVMYGALLVVLFVGPATGSGLGWAHDAIRSYLVRPFAAEGSRIAFLSAKERSHIRDVDVLFDAAFVFGVAAVGVLAGTTLFVRRRALPARDVWGRVLWFAGLGTIATMALLGLGALLDFGRFWETFHEVFFPQGNWRFSYDSMLIRIYPTSYFEAFVLRWTILVIGCSVVLALVGRRFTRRAASDGQVPAAATTV